jgi:hypothetical protein
MAGDFDEGFNLHEIHRGLRDLEASGGQAALSLRNERTTLVEKRRALRQARAQATLAATGTVQVKAAHVDIATDQEQYDHDLADVAVRYAVDLVEERSSTRMSLQTRAKLALEAMRLAGYGGGA